MARDRIEQIPDEYVEDLNPEYEAGENHSPRRYQTVPAFDLKAVHARLSGLDDQALKQIPVMVEGSRLEQGAVYLDLLHPEAGAFKAMGDMVAGPDNAYVPKSDLDFELWNRLTGVRDPYRLGTGGSRG